MPPAENLRINIPGGVRVTVPNSPLQMTPYILLEQEDWFEDEIHFVRTLVGPGDRVVDIGANYGLYTLSMARLIGTRGRLWAFEPASNTVGFLNSSVRDNGFEQVTVVQQALSDHVGKATLFLSKDPELNTLQTDNLGNEAETEVVPLTTLDAAAAEHGIDELTFLKLDAEGEEVAILDGGGTILAAPGPLVMFELRHVNAVNRPLISRFGEIGYSIYRLVPGLGILVPFDVDTETTLSPLNLFAATDARAARLAERGLLARQPHSNAAPAVPGGAWRDCLAALPSSQAMLDGLGDGGPMADVLDLHIAAHDIEHTPAKRYHLLGQACARATELVTQDNTLWRRMTQARLHSELGQRSLAYPMLLKLAQTVSSRPALDPTEPFLSPHSRYDHVAPDGRLLNWTIAACTEAFERALGFSDYFVGSKALPVLEFFATLGFPSPQMARRRQLMRMRVGQQNSLEPEAQLTRAGPEHLNPAIWSTNI